MISSTLKLNRVSKLKFLLVAAAVIGFVSLMGSCKKTTTTQVVSSDSVYYSAWIPLVMAEQPGDSTWLQTVSAPQVTDAIVNNGAVLGYFLTANFSNDSASIDVTSDPDFEQLVSIGTIQLFDEYDDIQQYVPDYRYVVVPGTISVTDITTKEVHVYTPTELKSMPYSQVSAILNIPSKGSGSPSNVKVIN